MWKVIVSPVENECAWETFMKQGIIGIGWCDAGMDYEKPVVEFQKIRKGDWIVAHLPKERSGQSFLAVGVGRVIGDYDGRFKPRPDDAWNGSFRRQFTVDWVSTARKRMPDLFTRCNYRTTVCRLREDVANKIMRRYGLPSQGES